MPDNQLVLFKKKTRSAKHSGPRNPDEPPPEASIPSSRNSASPTKPYHRYLWMRNPHTPLLLLLSSLTLLWLASVTAYNIILAIAGALTTSSLLLALKFFLFHIKGEQAARLTTEWETKLREEKKKWEQSLAKLEREIQKYAVQQKESELDALEQRWNIIAKYEKEKAEQRGRRKKEIEAEMRKKLEAYGFHEHQVEAVLHPKPPGPPPVGVAPADAPTPPRCSPVPVFDPPPVPESPPIPEPPPIPESSKSPQPPPHNQPEIYIRIRRGRLSRSTLRYYGIIWKPDETDPGYMIIPQALNEKELDILFEHTRRLRGRAGRLLLEENHF